MQGKSYNWPSINQVLAHFGYANSILGFKWLNPVFWTLSLEFQFYLFMSIFFGFISLKNNKLAMALLFLFSLFPLIFSNKAFLTHWIGFFILGMLIYRHLIFKSSPFWLIGIGILNLCICAYTSGCVEMYAGFAASLYILLSSKSSQNKVFSPFLWLGTISYSLYLTHWDFGRAGVAFARHIPLFGSSGF